MRILSFLIFFSLLLGLALPVCAKQKNGYNGNKWYSGSYQGDRLYQLDAAESAWYASKRPEDIKDLRCSEARWVLRDTGSWTGNLSDLGKCLGDAEAPTWATGNYLNYLNREDAAKQGDKE